MDLPSPSCLASRPGPAPGQTLRRSSCALPQSRRTSSAGLFLFLPLLAALLRIAARSLTRWLSVATLVALAALLSACTTPDKKPPEPWDESRLLDLELIPPVYELLTPSPSLQASLGLRASAEVVAARLIPSFQDWEEEPGPLQELFQTGQASWYGDRFHGRLTANGERYNMNALTAAHRTLPFGTEVCVRGLLSGKEVLVRINDRGPYVGRRVIDLSRAAADRLGMLSQGLKSVALWIPGENGPACGNGDAPLEETAQRKGSGSSGGGASATTRTAGTPQPRR